MTKILGILLVSISLLISCSKDNSSSSFNPSCSGTAKSYANDISPLIQSYCHSCHTNYSTFAQLSAAKNSVRSVIVSGSMPQGTTLSTDQKNAIICWIDNGAANN
jgi:uncharacterized membrane protein